MLKREISYFFDIDGTLDNGTKGEMHPEILGLLATWICRGANLIFVTNRPRMWVAQKLLVPLGKELPRNPAGRVWALCEQGCIVSSVSLRVRAMLQFRDLTVFTLGKQLQKSIKVAFETAFSKGQIHGCFRQGLEHQVCVENVSYCRSGSPYQILPANIRPKVRLISTRSTISVIPRDAGKAVAVRYILRSFPEIDTGYKLGFGDDGDEFASVVPVIDVDRYQRHTFEKKGLPATPSYDLEALKAVVPCRFESAVVKRSLQQGGGDATAAILASILRL
jgi:hydroxymethylpyrimidine pyrophosphatase-like HAD family hydrolase